MYLVRAQYLSDDISFNLYAIFTTVCDVLRSGGVLSLSFVLFYVFVFVRVMWPWCLCLTYQHCLQHIFLEHLFILYSKKSGPVVTES